MYYSFSRTFAAGIFMLITVFSISAQAQELIKLKTKFLSPVKYTIGDEAPRNIYSFTGMDAEPHFKKLISRYPEAVKEIKASYTYNGVSLIGSLVMVTGSVLMLSNTLKEANDVSNGKLSSDQDDITPLLLILGGAVLGGIEGTIAGSHLRKCVKIYNSKQKNLPDMKDATGVHIFLKPKIHYSLCKK